MNKMRKVSKGIVYIFIANLVLLTACIKPKEVAPSDGNVGINALQISEDFDFESTADVDLSVEVTLNNEPLAGVPLRIFDNLPPSVYNDANVTEGILIASGRTNSSGVFEIPLNLPTDLEHVFIQSDYLGIPDITTATIVNGRINTTISDNNNQNRAGRIMSNNVPSNSLSKARTARVYNYLGEFDSDGVPEYLEPQPDEISADFLTDVNNSLPERAPVPDANPEYLADGNETDIILVEEADVWVTFVHEGAGYRNVLGYYTYDNSNPPATADDIADLNIIFPNTSFTGSGGGLTSGDKVNIGRYPAGTGIGWFIVANGWNGSAVGDGLNIFYSNPVFNPESSESLKQHNVLLKDVGRNLVLMGFEDIKRDTFSDEDFNDAIFYITASPFSAIQTGNLPPVTSNETDTDGDNIVDEFDDYPNDPTRAFDNYYPGRGVFGTLAFEDLWPNRGDYDFNDLVVDYNFNQLTNNDNKITAIEAKFIVKAIGAGFQNGFGFQMNVNPGEVVSVTGLDLQEDIITLNANNTEAGQDKATIIVFDNAYRILRHPGGGQNFVNTELGSTYVEPDTITINIVFDEAKSIADIGLAPYNPFLIVNKERGKEIHLPGYPPTSLANTSYFGTGIDDSDVDSETYYKSNGNLPWAMNIPLKFEYPVEFTDVTEAHLTFAEWVQSSGFSRQDWYKNKLGYRNTSKIFTK